MLKEDVSGLMDLYPRIYFATHLRHMVDLGADVKLTANQLSILDHLEADDPVSLYDLSMHMGVTPSTMSITIERLVKLGYVARERAKSDGRKINLTLTKKGVSIKKKKSVLDPKLVEALLKRLNADERKRAIDGLSLLAYAADIEMKAKSISRAWTKR